MAVILNMFLAVSAGGEMDSCFYGWMNWSKKLTRIINLPPFINGYESLHLNSES